MTQSSLFDSIETQADQKFREFHRDNPEVYRRLVALAREAVQAGRKKMSIELLVNVVRWEQFLITHDKHSEFKINNNYKSRYARKIMDENGDLKDIFNTREMKS